MNSTTTKLATVEQLNAIQARWMALDSDDSDAKKNALFRDYAEHIPSTYVAASVDLTKGLPIVQSQPVWSECRTLAEAIQWVKDYSKNHCKNVRSDVVWISGTGHFVKI